MEYLLQHLHQIGMGLLYTYLISAVLVALILLWIYDQVMTEMHVEKAIITVYDWWAWYIFLGAMVFCPVINTLIVLYAIDCHRPKYST